MVSESFPRFWLHASDSLHISGRQPGAADMAIHLHKQDLPETLDLGPVVAIDCETMGLDPRRDRLCVVQLSAGDGDAHLVQIARGQTEAPNLCRLLADAQVLKLFHYGASISPRCITPSARWRSRSGVPRSPAVSCAPIQSVTGCGT